MINKIFLAIIRVYQKTISPDHGIFAYKHPYGYCRFQPTCSEYAYQAIEKYGLIKGFFLATKRVLKCNPFNKNIGVDQLK
ncbi:MAG: membrane protein insertion efficiency factor YidD [Patescibacteria group bacterium]|jgi:hypothetical protein